MRLSLGLGCAALAWCLVAGTALVLLDTYSGVECGPEGCVTSGATLIEVNGPQVLIALAIPVLLTAVGLAALLAGARTWLQWLPTGLLAVFCFLAMFSIGLAYLPAALLLIGGVVTNGDYRRSRQTLPSS